MSKITEEEILNHYLNEFGRKNSSVKVLIPFVSKRRGGNSSEKDLYPKKSIEKKLKVKSGESMKPPENLLIDGVKIEMPEFVICDCLEVVPSSYDEGETLFRYGFYSASLGRAVYLSEFEVDKV